MIGALENNTVGLVLASICGALLAVCLGLVVVWALPPSGHSGAGDAGEGDVSADITSLQSARPLEDYAAVSERPVFNEDRRPAPVLAEEGLEDALPEEEYTGAPDVELAGIVITPTLRMATLRLKEEPRSLVAFEGKPLEGDFGTWQVSRIDARKVTLASAEGEELQLELQVHDAMIAQPPETKRPAARPEAEAGEEEAQAQVDESTDSEPLTRAEQIRQRIEERREELRRAAEERDAAQAENYRDAIQSMIQRSQRQTQEEPENEDG